MWRNQLWEDPGKEHCGQRKPQIPRPWSMTRSGVFGWRGRWGWSTVKQRGCQEMQVGGSGHGRTALWRRRTPSLPGVLLTSPLVLWLRTPCLNPKPFPESSPTNVRQRKPGTIYGILPRSHPTFNPQTALSVAIRFKTMCLIWSLVFISSSLNCEYSKVFCRKSNVVIFSIALSSQISLNFGDCNYDL